VNVRRHPGTGGLTKRGALAAFAVATWIGAAHLASSQSTDDSSFARPGHFSAQNGEALYRQICQACHMADGKGAKGAGTYPPLANNARLAASDYPTSIILGGRRAMPEFAPSLSDEQAAAVVEYVRTHLGNDYPEPVHASDVARVRRLLKK
jgi:mono/diheme cytochrome c family protein